MHTVALSAASPRPDYRACGLSASIAHAKCAALPLVSLVVKGKELIPLEAMIHKLSIEDLGFPYGLFVYRLEPLRYERPVFRETEAP